MKATLKDSMGTDLSVVNAARVSFAKESQWEVDQDNPDEDEFGIFYPNRLSPADKRLIHFLARGMTENEFETFVNNLCDEAEEVNSVLNELLDQELAEVVIKRMLWSFRNQPQHSSPFRHCFATFHVKAPIFVARQLVKHQVGMSWNEVSRRYVDDEPEFWWPEYNGWRTKSENKKQGSGDTIKSNDLSRSIGAAMHTAEKEVLSAYNYALSSGVAPEMARMILPQNTYTEWVWSGSLQSWAHVCNLRCHPEAQQETRELCLQIDEQCATLWPVSWNALRNGG